MVKGLIGKKLNMSQRFDTHGKAVPVTEISVQPNYVIQIKDLEKDGYRSAQIGIGTQKNPSKPLMGHIKKSKLEKAPKTLREVRFDGEIEVGKEVKVAEVFNKGGIVDIVGVSKGKGFAGVVKRHGFSGGPRTHGQSDRERAPGSIGATTTPGRVLKGTRMAGHMGAERVKIQALEILDIDSENNTLVVKGSVPGPNQGLLIIEKSRKKKKKYHEPDAPAVPVLGKKEGEEEVKDGSKEQVEAPAAEKKEEPKDGEENKEQN